MRNWPARFWDKVALGEQCWVWTANVNHRGYGRVLYRGKVQQAHRVAWEMVHGPIPDGLFVLHHCDNPPCVNPDHLFVGTHSDNMVDAVRKGRHARAKVTEADVRDIRTARASGEGVRALARRYRVDPKTIRDLLGHENWKHVA